jgi:hypothetical protein
LKRSTSNALEFQTLPISWYFTKREVPAPHIAESCLITTSSIKLSYLRYEVLTSTRSPSCGMRSTIVWYKYQTARREVTEDPNRKCTLLQFSCAADQGLPVHLHLGACDTTLVLANETMVSTVSLTRGYKQILCDVCQYLRALSRQ